MIEYLSKERECTITNMYLSELLNISKVQSSRIINSLKKKDYIRVELVYKSNSKEIALRKITPVCKYDNTYKQINTKPINTNVKEIISNNKKYNKNIWKSKNERDYSNFEWTSLYANKILQKT